MNNTTGSAKVKSEGVMDQSERESVTKLRAIPIFAELSDETLESILRTATEFEAPAGRILVQPNQPGAGLFVIEEGTCVVELKDRKVELAEGQFFGELALLDDRAVHSARVRTSTPVRCLAITRDDFGHLLHSEPKMAISVLKVLARRLADSARH
jgi:CRP/FNR family transcriptional regulator, cyclic AMP receptor protein